MCIPEAPGPSGCLLSLDTRTKCSPNVLKRLWQGTAPIHSLAMRSVTIDQSLQPGVPLAAYSSAGEWVLGRSDGDQTHLDPWEIQQAGLQGKKHLAAAYGCSSPTPAEPASSLKV